MPDLNVISNIKEERQAKIEDLAKLTLAAAVGGPDGYFNMDAASRSTLLTNITNRLSSMQTKDNPLMEYLQRSSVSSVKETVDLITEIRDSVLKNPAISGEIKEATKQARQQAFETRAKFEEQQKHLTNEALLAKYVGKYDLEQIRKVENATYPQRLEAVATHLRKGKADVTSLTALGLNESEIKAVIQNVAKDINLIQKPEKPVEKVGAGGFIDGKLNRDPGLQVG